MTHPQEQNSEWMPIDGAPDLERVMVAGWNKPTKNVQDYWWWHEDVICDGKGFDHPEATHWCRIVLPPFPPTPSSQGDAQ